MKLLFCYKNLQKSNIYFFKVLTNAGGALESVSDLYHSTIIKQNLNQKIDETTILKNLNSALKKDDSISNLRLAFNLAATLKSGANEIFDRIEDVIVQADEINAKLLQFEGGLSTTAGIITGAYALAKKVAKPPSISKSQAVKFANYFLTRKNIQDVKGAYELLQALSTFASNDFHIPVAVTLSSTTSVSEANPVVKIEVTDIMGGSLGPMSVQIGKPQCGKMKKKSIPKLFLFDKFQILQ